MLNKFMRSNIPSKKWSESRDLYVNITRYLDNHFSVIEQDKKAFFYYVAGWVWFRHDNLRGYVHQAYYGINNRRARRSVVRQGYGILRASLRAFSLCLRRPKRIRTKRPRVLLFYNGFSGARMGALYSRIKNEVDCADFHLKDSLTISRKTPLNSVYAYISPLLVIKSLIKGGGYLFC
jgi:hypothetical protein